jgi:hypothetical protein
MRKIQVWARLTDQHYHAYECEARRQGVPLENLVEQTVNALLRELELEEAEGGSHDLSTS